MSAFLNVLGYDAKTLKFGANSMSTGDLPAGKHGVLHNIMDYDYESNITK